MTTMYDSTTPGAIPRNAAIVAGYVDGKFAWTQAQWNLFPAATHLTITVAGLAGAAMADIEKGDLTPTSGVAWYHREVANGRHPKGLYYNLSTRGEVLDNGGGAIPWWAADPTGTQHLVPGSVATQYAWPGRGSPGAFDLSVTDGTWPGTMPPVTDKPLVVAIITDDTDTGYWLVAADGGVFTFGGAQFYGSMGGKQLSAPVVDAVASPDGKGYALVGADGAVYNFGSSVYEGGTNK